MYVCIYIYNVCVYVYICFPVPIKRSVLTWVSFPCSGIFGGQSWARIRHRRPGRLRNPPSRAAERSARPQLPIFGVSFGVLSCSQVHLTFGTSRKHFKTFLGTRNKGVDSGSGGASRFLPRGASGKESALILVSAGPQPARRTCPVATSRRTAAWRAAKGPGSWTSLDRRAELGEGGRFQQGCEAPGV